LLKVSCLGWGCAYSLSGWTLPKFPPWMGRDKGWGDGGWWGDTNFSSPRVRAG